MTNFIKMPPIGEVEKKKPKKTVFKKIVGFNPIIGAFIEDTNDRPKEWQNVMHLWKDKDYGDVFRCFDDANGSDSTIYFGEAGDEFNQ